MDAERWTGPRKVTAVISACAYAVKREGTNKCKVVNVGRLVPFVPRDLRWFPTEGQNDDDDVSEKEGESTGSITAEESTAEAEATPDEVAMESAVLSAPLRTQRNQRNRRPPAWTQAFDMSWAE